MRRKFVALLAVVLTGLCVAGLPAGAEQPRGVGAGDPLPLIGASPSPSPKPSPKPAAKPAPKPQPPTATPENRWALIVGVTNYRGKVKDTRGGANDARLVRDVLLRHGWRSDRIRILTDDRATGRAVAEGLAWLQRNSSSRTFSFFHYSGHVKQMNGREYLWPVDNAYIADTEMSRVLRALGGTAWTNISGCEAGGFNEGLSGPRHLFTGSSNVTEKSYENDRTGYSVWTGMMFAEGLRDKKADRDGDGGVSVNEAYQYAAPRAKQFTRNQRPHGPQTPERFGGNGSLNLAKPRI